MKVAKLVKSGLSSNQLKWIAIIFMTIDHVGASSFNIPILADYIWILRLLGRIAAPLFLFTIVESCKYTRSKPKFILRLYIAGVSVGLFTTLTNFFLGDSVGYFLPGNIIFTFFYTVVYIFIIENALKAIKEKNYKQFAIFILLMIASYIPHIIFQWFHSFQFTELQLREYFLVQGLFNSFMPNPFYLEYSLIFVLLGVAMYFSKQKIAQCIVYTLFCILSFFGLSFVQQYNLSQYTDYFGYPQYWMILALPFMLFYNGKHGKAQKLFFYVYYPVHRYVINVIMTLLILL